MNQKFYWLRWIGVLPAALTSYLIAYAVLKLAVFLSIYLHFEERDWLQEFTLPAFAAGWGAYGFVHAGAFVAPLHKRTTALILLILISFIVGIAILLLFRKYSNALLMETLGQIVGAFVAYKRIEEENPV